MAFQIAVGQFAPEKAEVETNLDQIAAITLQAAGEGAKLAVLPEASTSGYFLEGGVLESSLGADDLASRLERRFQGKLPDTIDLVLGFYENDRGNLYNSAAHLTCRVDGTRVNAVYRKFFLPTYGVFDEERFVSRGRELCVFDSSVGRMGLLICEDVWHGILPTLCAVRGAQVLLVPSASPARGFQAEDIDNHDRYRRLLRAISEEHGVFCVNSQLCGFEGGKGFTGGSMAFDPLGKSIGESPLGEPSMMIVEIDLDLVGIARSQSPLLNDLQSAWGDIRRLVGESEF